MIGGDDTNAQQIMEAVDTKMMEVFMEECGWDHCEPEEPAFDDMATFFDELDLNLQLTQDAYDFFFEIDTEADDF
jgi:hypothetical protein